jgi:hypothetical protein
MTRDKYKLRAANRLSRLDDALFKELQDRVKQLESDIADKDRKIEAQRRDFNTKDHVEDMLFDAVDVLSLRMSNIFVLLKELEIVDQHNHRAINAALDETVKSFRELIELFGRNPDLTGRVNSRRPLRLSGSTRLKHFNNMCDRAKERLIVIPDDVGRFPGPSEELN